MYATKIFLLLCAFSVLIGESEAPDAQTSGWSAWSQLYSGFSNWLASRRLQTSQALRRTQISQQYTPAGTQTPQQYTPAGTQTPQTPRTTSTQTSEELTGKVNVVTTVKTFEEFLQNVPDNQLVVIYHTMIECTACGPFTQKINEYAKTYGTVIFIKVIWDDMLILSKPYEVYQIGSYPTVQFTKKEGGVLQLKENLNKTQIRIIEAKIKQYK